MWSMNLFLSVLRMVEWARLIQRYQNWSTILTHRLESPAVRIWLLSYWITLYSYAIYALTDLLWLRPSSSHCCWSVSQRDFSNSFCLYHSSWLSSLWMFVAKSFLVDLFMWLLQVPNVWPNLPVWSMATVVNVLLISSFRLVYLIWLWSHWA